MLLPIFSNARVSNYHMPYKSKWCISNFIAPNKVSSNRQMPFYQYPQKSCLLSSQLCEMSNSLSILLAGSLLKYNLYLEEEKTKCTHNTTILLMSKNIFKVFFYFLFFKSYVLGKCQKFVHRKKQFCCKCRRTTNSHIFNFSFLFNPPIFNLWGSKEPIRP